ncbi:unnamed protein product [Caenorhabditis auriculariae]|uniref:Uncharacterized protein n=1 Tax=Caenorhabditis auriculariae TaxID=2777116 RepID=A0A8S1H074_9PELO|nr:unnamed protein product [Caenorhabditis auriculariae]
MEPDLSTEIQIFQEKLMGKKWKSQIACIYSGSRLGKPRFGSSPNDYARGLCIHKARKDGEWAPSASQKNMWQSCRAHLLDSPSDDIEILDFPEEYPLLKLKTVNSREATEGVYSLQFGEGLLVKGQTSNQCIPYTSLTWVATGEHCIGFEADRYGIMEFATGDPLQIIEHFRSYLKFSCNFTPPRTKTICRFNRYYHPVRQAGSTSASPIISNNSTMESTGSNLIDSDEYGALSLSHTSVQAEQTYIGRVVEEELRKSTENVQKKESPTNRKSFLRGTKKENKRGDLEASSDFDFVRVINMTEKSEKLMSPPSQNKSMASLLQQELKRSLEERQISTFKPPPHVPRQTDL